MTQFSVLMSVYYNENAHYLDKALESIFNQEAKPSEVILVKDGPLTDSLEAVIGKYQKEAPLLKLINLPENQGLGKALAEGLKYCNYELVARMDSDDICKPCRFKRQLAFMQDHPDVAVAGGHIEEFQDEPGDLRRLKKVPLNYLAVRKYSFLRSPLNHPSVMFRKSAVENVGSYKDMALFEDYYLWFRLLHHGYKITNSDHVLLNFRVPQNIFNRRHGWDYLKKEIYFFSVLKKEHYISTRHFILMLCIRIPMRLLPKFLLSAIYRRFLRRQH